MLDKLWSYMFPGPSWLQQQSNLFQSARKTKSQKIWFSKVLSICRSCLPFLNIRPIALQNCTAINVFIFLTPLQIWIVRVKCRNNYKNYCIVNCMLIFTCLGNVYSSVAHYSYVITMNRTLDFTFAVGKWNTERLRTDRVRVVTANLPGVITVICSTHTVALQKVNILGCLKWSFYLFSWPQLVHSPLYSITSFQCCSHTEMFSFVRLLNCCNKRYTELRESLFIVKPEIIVLCG